MQRKGAGRAGAKDSRLTGDVAAQCKVSTGGDVWLRREWSMLGAASGLNMGQESRLLCLRKVIYLGAC